MIAINKFTKQQKIKYILIVSLITLLLIVGLPSLARYKNRISFLNVTVWDGTISNNYHSGTGTVEDPYIITNGNELAYFSEQLKTNDYNGIYFKLGKDILLNDGTFEYDDNAIIYHINEKTYYLDEYLNNYYENILSKETINGSVNSFKPCNNFKGHFDGDFHTISGLYITDDLSNELGLFTNLNGTIENIYIQNSIVYGGGITGGIVSNSDNSIINNVLYNGYVVGTKSNTVNDYIMLEDINIILNNDTKSISIDNQSVPMIGGTIESLKITGNCNSTSSTVKINNSIIENGDFLVDLGTNLDNIVIDANSTTSDTVSLSNLKIVYSTTYSISAGIAAQISNTTINNLINKANIYSSSDASGLIGYMKESTINQGYNLGNVTSNSLGTGLVNKVVQSENTTISKIYNNALINSEHSSNLIGEIVNSTVSLNYTFGISNTGYSVYKINNSILNTYHAYYYDAVDVYDGIADFTLTTLEDLKTKQYLLDNLQYLEFSDINSINDGNVWIYKDELPKLYIDDIDNPDVTIYSGIYNWNNYSNDLTIIKYDNNITFSIEKNTEVNTIKSIHYYMSDKELTISELNDNKITWTNYNNIVQETDEGIYIIYVKITDNNNNVFFINTDKLVLDKSEPIISIGVDNNVWNTYSEDLTNIYLNNKKNITIDANDDISGIKNIFYYMSPNTLNKNELNKITEWNEYISPIEFDNKESTVIYVKVLDEFDYETYCNTDYLSVKGYTKNIIVDGVPINTNSINITNSSSVIFDYSFNEDIKIDEEYMYNLTSNMLLPSNTLINLIDYDNNSVYKYSVTEDNYGYDESCDVNNCKYATYPFYLFKKIGKSTEELFNTNYEINISKHFRIVLDFSKAEILSDLLNLNFNINIISNKNIFSTLQDTSKTLNIYVNKSADLSLTTKYNSEIILNSNFENKINLLSTLNYKTINDDVIYDTNYNDKQMGLAIKLEDENGNIINYSDYKNLSFKINDKMYYPSNDNITRINLNNDLNTFDGILSVITKEDNLSLKSGLYYLKIHNYVSYNGISFSDLYNEISIPVLVDDDIVKIDYNFDVNMITNQIINKQNDKKMTFKILVNGDLKNPNIRVSLYKKEKLTAYDQNYVLLDLKKYVLNSLVEIENNVYYVTNNPIIYNKTTETLNILEYELNISRFESNGYKLLFQLYDDDKLIGDIDRKFIVR